jgi:hypothetical protein
MRTRDITRIIKKEGTMKKLIAVAGLVMFLSIAMVSDVKALGLGFYGSIGGGSGEAELESDGPGNTSFDFDVDNDHASFGFVLDTAVAKDTLFNYRLSLGYEQTTSTDEWGDDLDLSGLVIDNDFGFGVVRNEKVRLWVGPEVRLSFLSGDLPTHDVTAFGFGIGPVVGLNLNLGDVAALGFKLSYLFNSYGADMSAKNSNLYYDGSYSMTENLVTANVALIFRLGEE